MFKLLGNFAVSLLQYKTMRSGAMSFESKSRLSPSNTFFCITLRCSWFSQWLSLATHRLLVQSVSWNTNPQCTWVTLCLKYRLRTQPLGAQTPADCVARGRVRETVYIYRDTKAGGQSPSQAPVVKTDTEANRRTVQTAWALCVVAPFKPP